MTASSIKKANWNDCIFGDLFPRHWEVFAKDSGFSPAQVKKRLLQMAGLIPGKARQLLKTFTDAGLGHGILADIAGIIEERCALSIQRLKA